LSIAAFFFLLLNISEGLVINVDVHNGGIENVQTGVALVECERERVTFRVIKEAKISNELDIIFKGPFIVINSIAQTVLH
jgi:hypothetical protein